MEKCLKVTIFFFGFYTSVEPKVMRRSYSVYLDYDERLHLLLSQPRGQSLRPLEDDNPRQPPVGR